MPFSFIRDYKTNARYIHSLTSFVGKHIYYDTFVSYIFFLFNKDDMNNESINFITVETLLKLSASHSSMLTEGW